MPRKASASDFDDNKYYSVQLRRSVEYPPGSKRIIPVGAKLTMRGSACKVIAEDISDAQPKS